MDEIFENEKNNNLMEQEIISILHNLFELGTISKDEKNCFYLYYFPELRMDIRNMSLIEVNDYIRKISLRKIEGLTGINYNMVNKHIKRVVLLIKERIKKQKD